VRYAVKNEKGRKFYDSGYDKGIIFNNYFEEAVEDGSMDMRFSGDK